MATIKILECIPAIGGVSVRWQIIDNGAVVDELFMNFDPTLSAAGLKKTMARVTREHLDSLNTPVVPPDLSEDIGSELPLEEYEDPVTLEVIKARKISEIDLAVFEFLRKKGDGNPRYEVQHQIATLASMFSAKEKLKSEALTSEEKGAAKAKYNQIIAMWAWMEQVFQAQMVAKAQVEAAQTIEEIAGINFDLTPLESQDPDIYLADIWDRPGEEA